MNRRNFLRSTASIAAFTIVPRHVLGGAGYLAPSDTINMAVIGTGKQSHGLMKNFMATGDVRIVAVCDVYEAKLNAFVSEWKVLTQGQKFRKKDTCKPYAEYRKLLKKKHIDAVIIATPDHTHALIAVEAAEAGKDIYCEKPLSLTVREGRAMVEATRRNKRVFQTGSMQRSWPEFRHAAELIRNEYLGDIREIKVSVDGPPKPYDLIGQPVPDGLDWDHWLGPNDFKPYHVDLAPGLSDTFWAKWRNYKEFGGGGMTDWGAYMFDIVQWSLNMDSSGPVDVFYPDGRDYKFLTYRYANGIQMTHENFGKNNGIRFIGSEGQLDVQRKILETTPASLKDKIISDQENRVYFSDNHYKDFIKAMRNRSKPICDVETGHRTATVCNIGNIAYELKRSLKWDPEKEEFPGDAQANAMLSRPMRKEWSIKM